jgi:hypothetical protein
MSSILHSVQIRVEMYKIWITFYSRLVVKYTQPTQMKLQFASQQFVNNAYTEFHERPANLIVADARSQAHIRPNRNGRRDGSTWCPYKALFYCGRNFYNSKSEATSIKD